MYQRYINPLSTLDPGIAERDVAPAPFRKTSFSGLVEEVLSTAPSRPLRSVRLTKEKAVPSATPSERSFRSCKHGGVSLLSGLGGGSGNSLSLPYLPRCGGGVFQSQPDTLSASGAHTPPLGGADVMFAGGPSAETMEDDDELHRLLVELKAAQRHESEFESDRRSRKQHSREGNRCRTPTPTPHPTL